jgi:hypothetical protein
MILFARAPASPAAELVLEPVSKVLGRQVDAVEALAGVVTAAGSDLGSALGPSLSTALLVLVVLPAVTLLLAAAVTSARTAATALLRRTA